MDDYQCMGNFIKKASGEIIPCKFVGQCLRTVKTHLKRFHSYDYKFKNCEICNQELENYNQYNIHMQNVHNKSIK